MCSMALQYNPGAAGSRHTASANTHYGLCLVQDDSDEPPVRRRDPMTRPGGVN